MKFQVKIINQIPLCHPADDELIVSFLSVAEFPPFGRDPSDGCCVSILVFSLRPPFFLAGPQGRHRPLSTTTSSSHQRPTTAAHNKSETSNNNQRRGAFGSDVFPPFGSSAGGRGWHSNPIVMGMTDKKKNVCHTFIFLWL